MTSKRSTRLRLLCVVGALTLVMTACGDDDSSSGGGGGATLSDEEFCEQLEALEESEAELDGPEAFALMGQLARRAPNAELREALSLFAGLAEQLEGLDEDDPEAIGIMFGIIFDPEFIAAAETLETYLSEVCGFDTGDSGEFGGDFGSGVDGDGSAWDDLDSGELREALVPAFERFAPDNRGTGIGIFPRGRGTVVDVSVYDTDLDSAAAIGLCEALADAVDSRTSDPGVILEVSVDDEVVAGREPGGSCITN
jgi:hypothetical protein